MEKKKVEASARRKGSETRESAGFRLFSYTLRVDDGAAPNPYHGMCSLAICKPSIRRVAEVGDWVVGLGSKNAPSGNFSGKLVYAMRVGKVLSLKEYDQQARAKWRHRIPNVHSANPWERLGDCIYDYSRGSRLPRQRPSVHGPGNVARDLGGEKVLISRDFYYFGSCPKKLPASLHPICHQTQGHRSTANAPFRHRFVKWLRSRGFPRGRNGRPDFPVDWSAIHSVNGCSTRKRKIKKRGSC